MPSTLKKTLELLVAQGNDYLVAVKNNQPKLMQAFETVVTKETPQSQSESEENFSDILLKSLASPQP
jgi:hypothetical protein